MRSHSIALAIRLLLLSMLLAGWNQPLSSQDRTPKNLQYYPKDISRQELVQKMRQFSFALGVACTHCHGTQEQTGFNLRGVDFSLDIKPAKSKAREMLRMVDEINNNLLAAIAKRSELKLGVSCFTCHSGIPLPETIEQRVIRTATAQGIEAAIADYRRLRERHFGSAAYNFGEQPLVEVSQEFRSRKLYRESVDISQLNLEFFPQSGQTIFGLAEAYFQLGEDGKARSHYEKILEMRPNDRRSKGRLEELKKRSR